MKSILAALLLMPFFALAPGIEEHLASMKTTKADVQDLVQNDIGYGTFSYPSACALIPVAKRAAVVRAAGEFARALTKTKVFQEWYESFREQRKPSAPEGTPSMAESRAKQIAELKRGLAEQEKAQANAPADQKGIYRDVVASLRQMLKDVEKTDPSQDAQMDAIIKQSNDQASKEFKDKLAAWDKEYPAGDPRPLVKLRLKEFLDATANIDFSAKLVKSENVMVFVNPAYETKDGRWKTAFRAGKEATDAARAFAAQWLKEL
jgi:RNA polymerase-interacting CarD/CdnL/TRCF family regulator